MRAHRFSHRDAPHGALQDPGPPASSALVRWLRQGLEMGMCPLCRVAHKADREFIWHFSEEGSGSLDAMEELRRARGFCLPHAEMLTQIDVEMRSMLGISSVYVELFDDLVTELAHTDPSEQTATLPCPACANRDRALNQNARYLLGLLASRPGFVERYRNSPGLCFPHLGLVWSAGGSPATRQILLEVQRRAVTTIDADLKEFIRKEGVEAKGEPKGAEQDAWRRAIELTAGWPAPRSSAAVPETASAPVEPEPGNSV